MPVVGLSWPVLQPDLRVVWWRIYGSPDGPQVKGGFLGKVPASERSFWVEVEEGWWWFSIVGVTAAGAETPWDATEARIERYVHGREESEVPPTIANLAGGFTDTDECGVRFECDPPARSSRPHRVQVVAAPPSVDVSLRKLVHEFLAEPSGPVGDDGARLPTFLFPYSGFGRSGTQRFLIRGMGADGKPGPASELLAAFPPYPLHLHPVELASIDRTTGARVAFPAAAATDGWEYGAGYGARFKQVPVLGSADWADWGGILGGSPGLWAAQRSAFSYYVDNAKIRTDELDLGAIRTFRLDLYDEAHRETAAGRWSNIPRYALLPYPAFPNEQLARGVRPGEGPHWLMREIGRDGKMRQPLRHVWWEVSVSDTTPVPVTDGDFRRYRGQWLSGRYFRARLCAIEPFGLHRIQTGNVRVVALLPRTVSGSNATPEGAVTASVGSRHIDEDTDAEYVKESGTGNTGWLEVGTSGRVQAFTLQRMSPGAGVTNGTMLAPDGSNATYPPLPAAGRVVGVAFVLSGTHTAGTLEVKASANGAALGGLVHSAGASDTHGRSTGLGDTLAAGDRLGAMFTTAAGWNGTGMLSVTIYVRLAAFP